MSTDAFNLPTGQYYIRNEESFSGIKVVEPDSEPSSGLQAEVIVGRPIEVYCPTVQQLWKLVALPNGRYKLFVDEAPTFESDKHLFASHSINPESGEEWVITRQNSYGQRNQYTIEKADKSAGWIAQKGLEDPQIAVRLLIVLPTEPPTFPPNQLWNIQPLAE